jgi:hypothetical protein
MRGQNGGDRLSNPILPVSETCGAASFPLGPKLARDLDDAFGV